MYIDINYLSLNILNMKWFYVLEEGREEFDQEKLLD